SADICWCSRFCAAAGIASHSAHAVTARAILFVIRRALMLLRRDHKMRAPIARPRIFVVGRVEREFLAVAHNAEPFGRDAARDEVGLDGNGTPLPKGQVVLRRPALVAMT